LNGSPWKNPPNPPPLLSVAAKKMGPMSLATRAYRNIMIEHPFEDMPPI